MRNIYRKTNIKKIIILSSFMIIATFMSIGYATLIKQINITGTANFLVSQTFLWNKLKTDYIATVGDGLYENTIDTDKYSYIGTNPNNYITFNNETWRILSVEDDNTVKIIRWNNAMIDNYDDADNRTATSTYCITPEYGCNSWMQKSVLTNGTASGLVENDSTLNTYLNTTFYNSIVSENKSMIVQHEYNIGGVTQNSTIQNALGEEINLTWTGYIGLPTITEMLYATGTTQNIGTSSSQNYLTNYTSSTKYIWTMSSKIDDDDEVWVILPDTTQTTKQAYLESETINDVTYQYMVLPVVHLNTSVKYVSGNGTISSPFIIE